METNIQEAFKVLRANVISEVLQLLDKYQDKSELVSNEIRTLSAELDSVWTCHLANKSPLSLSPSRDQVIVSQNQEVTQPGPGPIESPSTSSNGAVSGDFERGADVACSTPFVPQPSPPPSNSKETPRKFSISQSYAKQGFGHVPLQFCPPQGDLSGEYFNPYAIRLTSRGEQVWMWVGEEN